MKMGVSINNTVATALKEGLDFIAQTENQDLAQLEVAVRTRERIDDRFYLDIESGKLLITPESFYKREKEELSEWDWTALVASWRYYRYRSSTAAAGFPAKIVARYFGDNFSGNAKMRIAHQFANVDQKDDGADAWNHLDDLNKKPWQKFYFFCKSYAEGFATARMIDDSECEVFFNPKTDRWHRVDRYIESPEIEYWVAREDIINMTK